MSYFVRISGNVFGPYDESQLLEMKSKGKIARITEISENECDWRAAETFDFLYIHTATFASQPSVNELVDRFHRANTGTQHDSPLVEQPESEPEAEPEFTFEIRLGRKHVPVTKSKLFELAQTGGMHPDDVVIIDGTEVFADSIKGIVFGNAPPVVAPPPPAIAPTAKLHTFPDLGKNGTSNAPNATDEPFFLVLPPRKKESVIGDFGSTLQTVFNRFSSSEEYYSVPKSIKLLCTILGVICLFIVGFFLIHNGGNRYGTVYIEGTVRLDSEPVSGVSVILHPRTENGSVAGGITKKGGKFTVTTDIVIDPTDSLRGTVPMVRGVKPGEYDVTFYKLAVNNRGALTLGGQSVPEYVIPQRYGDVKTSGLAPIKVEEKGQKTFTFELTAVNTDGKRSSN